MRSAVVTALWWMSRNQQLGIGQKTGLERTKGPCCGGNTGRMVSQVA